MLFIFSKYFIIALVTLGVIIYCAMAFNLDRKVVLFCRATCIGVTIGIIV